MGPSNKSGKKVITLEQVKQALIAINSNNASVRDHEHLYYVFLGFCGVTKEQEISLKAITKFIIDNRITLWKKPAFLTQLLIIATAKKLGKNKALDLLIELSEKILINSVEMLVCGIVGVLTPHNLESRLAKHINQMIIKNDDHWKWQFALYQIHFAKIEVCSIGKLAVAAKYLDELCKKGHVPAIMSKFVLYATSPDPKEKGTSLSLVVKAANAGLASAQSKLAEDYNMSSSEKNLKQAFEYYKKAAHQWEPVALCKMGDFYSEGEHIKQSNELAAEMYRRSAIQRYAPAIIKFADCNHRGVGVEKDLDMAIKLLKNARIVGSVDVESKHVESKHVESKLEEVYKTLYSDFIELIIAMFDMLQDILGINSSLNDADLKHAVNVNYCEANKATTVSITLEAESVNGSNIDNCSLANINKDCTDNITIGTFFKELTILLDKLFPGAVKQMQLFSDDHNLTKTRIFTFEFNSLDPKLPRLIDCTAGITKMFFDCAGMGDLHKVTTAEHHILNDSNLSMNAGLLANSMSDLLGRTRIDTINKPTNTTSDSPETFLSEHLASVAPALASV